MDCIQILLKSVKSINSFGRLFHIYLFIYFGCARSMCLTSCALLSFIIIKAHQRDSPSGTGHGVFTFKHRWLIITNRSNLGELEALSGNITHITVATFRDVNPDNVVTHPYELKKVWSFNRISYLFMDGMSCCAGKAIWSGKVHVDLSWLESLIPLFLPSQFCARSLLQEKLVLLGLILYRFLFQKNNLVQYVWFLFCNMCLGFRQIVDSSWESQSVNFSTPVHSKVLCRQTWVLTQRLLFRGDVFSMSARLDRSELLPQAWSATRVQETENLRFLFQRGYLGKLFSINFYPGERKAKEIGSITSRILNLYSFPRNEKAESGALEKKALYDEHLFPNLKYVLNGKHFVVTTLRVGTFHINREEFRKKNVFQCMHPHLDCSKGNLCVLSEYSRGGITGSKCF